MFWGKKKTGPPVVGCYGKLPAAGDFIRLNASSEELSAFDAWLASSVGMSKEALGGDFEAAYRPAVGLFIYRGPEPKGGGEPDRGLIGVWAASGDNAGRHYPMVVFASYDYEEMLATGPALPIALWPFLTSAYELVTAGRGLSVEDFLGRVALIQALSLENPAQSTSAYTQWLQHQQMGALWETGFGTASVRFWVVHNIMASVEIFRGQERPDAHLAIRYPLGAGDAYAAAVWMDMTLRLAGWQRTLLNAFWTPQRELLVHLGQPNVATFRELVAATADSDHISDLRRQPTMDDQTARERLGAELAKVVDRTDMRIDLFLQALS